MTSKFGRIYRITIGSVVPREKGLEPLLELFQRFYSRETLGFIKDRVKVTEDGEYIGGVVERTLADGFVIDDREMAVTITNTETSGAKQGSPSTIVLRNLEEEVLEFISTSGRVLVNVQAGYASEYSEPEDLPYIYIGYMSNSTTVRDDNSGDLVTTLSLKTFLYPRDFAKVSESFPAGTPVKEVFDFFVDVFESIGYPLQKFDGGFFTETVGRGYTVEGSLSDTFDQFLKDFGSGLSWSTSYHRLTVWTSKQFNNPTFNSGRVFGAPVGSIEYEDSLLTSINIDTFLVDASDMIGTPAKLVSKYDKKTTQNETGIDFKVLLDGRLEPSSIVTVTGLGDKDGTYIVKSVTHKLDYRGKEWSTTVQAFSVGRDLTTPPEPPKKAGLFPNRGKSNGDTD